MPFTITGAIQSEVWLEYSTDGGITWTRLTTLFPSGSSIETNDLPTNVDLKVRLVAFCDENFISNVLDYEISYIETVCNIQGYVDTRLFAGCKLSNLGNLTGYIIDEANSSFLITSSKNNGSGTGSLGFIYDEINYTSSGSLVIKTQNTSGDDTSYAGVDVLSFDLKFTKTGFPTKRIVSLDYPVKNISVSNLTVVYTTNIRIYE